MNEKIFGVGLHKTATTSLSVALNILGYSVTGPDGVNSVGDKQDAIRIFENNIGKYDAFQDNPYSVIYKHIDENIKNSKFVLTIRDPESWIDSVVNHFGGTETKMRKFIYGKNAGDPVGNEDVYKDVFKRHNNEVEKYFRGRNDFIIMNIVNGDGWDKLCPFLGLPEPPLHFPVVNKRDGSGSSRFNPWRSLIKRFYRYVL